MQFKTHDQTDLVEYLFFEHTRMEEFSRSWSTFKQELTKDKTIKDTEHVETPKNETPKPAKNGSSSGTPAQPEVKSTGQASGRVVRVDT